uniref:Uncharacterized protein n=1 Tax=Steinernema glaseri TaxID=37863 RepID=A0A1I8AAX8_9BILA
MCVFRMYSTTNYSSSSIKTTTTRELNSTNSDLTDRQKVEAASCKLHGDLICLSQPLPELSFESFRSCNRSTPSRRLPSSFPQWKRSTHIHIFQILDNFCPLLSSDDHHYCKQQVLGISMLIALLALLYIDILRRRYMREPEPEPEQARTEHEERVIQESVVVFGPYEEPQVIDGAGDSFHLDRARYLLRAARYESSDSAELRRRFNGPYFNGDL